VARRSEGGLGNSSDGGMGAPVEAQPTRIPADKKARTSLTVSRFMEEATGYQRGGAVRDLAW
jgi:hypothetical protein